MPLPSAETRLEGRPGEPDARGKIRKIGTFLKRHWRRLAIAALVLLTIIIGGTRWWLNARHYESTDDAFIDARTVLISGRVPGFNLGLEIGDFCHRLFHLRLGLGELSLVIARINAHQRCPIVDKLIVGNRHFGDRASRRESIKQRRLVTRAAAALSFAKEEAKRAQVLAVRGIGTKQNAQRTSSELRQAQADFDSAQAAAVAAQKQIAVLRAQLQGAVGKLNEARAVEVQVRTDRSRTTIPAPVAGRVAKLSAAKGDYATLGPALMVLVPREVWVTANFKETQLDDMRAGQKTTVRIDAYPGRNFAAHVDSIQPGSGSAFSLLPPENATGNFLKVVHADVVRFTRNASRRMAGNDGDADGIRLTRFPPG